MTLQEQYEKMKVVVTCGRCKYFKRFNDIPEYGTCQSKHTFDGAFRESDYCSYGKEKDEKGGI